MQSLIIIGAGKFGREVFCWASHCIQHGAPWRIIGFLDDRPNALDGYSYPVGIIGSVETYQPREGDVFTVAIGDPSAKKKFTAPITDKGGVFANIIHPLACVSLNVKMGRGIIMAPFTCVSCDATLGDFVTLNISSSVGHDAKIGGFCQISCHCDITGNAALEEGVFLGSHASILPGVRVGAWAMVGAGTVVLRDVPSRLKVAGVPARPIGKVEEPT